MALVILPIGILGGGHWADIVWDFAALTLDLQVRGFYSGWQPLLLQYQLVFFLQMTPYVLTISRSSGAVQRPKKRIGAPAALGAPTSVVNGDCSGFSIILAKSGVEYQAIPLCF